MAKAINQSYQPSPSSMTSLTNDPAHPFSPKELARLQMLVNKSSIPTYRGKILVSKGTPPDIKGSPVGSGFTGSSGSGPQIWLTGANEGKTLRHELGHVWSYYTSTPEQRQALMKQLHRKGEYFNYNDNFNPPMEQAADAYSIAQTTPVWKRWWGKETRRGFNDTSTAYNFRAGPKRYAAIRKIFSQQNGLM